MTNVRRERDSESGGCHTESSISGPSLGAGGQRVDLRQKKEAFMAFMAATNTNTNPQRLTWTLVLSLNISFVQVKT